MLVEMTEEEFEIAKKTLAKNNINESSIKDYTERMRELADNNDDDIEMRHVEMDNLMCEILKEMGFNELVDIFNETEKWYA